MASKRRWARTLVSIACSLFFLWLAARSIDLKLLVSSMSQVNPVMVVVGTLFAGGDFVLRSARYSELVCPESPVPFRRMFPSFMIGFMVNNLLPARLGDFVRAYAISRQENISSGATVGALVVERILDVIVMIMFLVAASSAMSLPESVVTLSIVVGASTMLLLAVLGLATHHRGETLGLAQTVFSILPHRLASPLIRCTTSFVVGLESLRQWRSLAFATALSLLSWTSVAVSQLLFVLAFNIDPPLQLAFLVTAVSGIVSSIPSAPGNVGTLHFAFVVAMGLVGIAREPALSVAIVYHAISWAWVTGLGLYFAWRVRFSLVPVRNASLERARSYEVV